MSARKPRCFVVMPFGKDSTADRERFDRIHKHVIQKPIVEAGYECVRGDELGGTDDIVDMLKSELAKADLVVADLTERNPNVFYELGFRHALGRPTITICSADELNGGGLPFNVRQYRTIPYQVGDFESVDQCRDDIRDLANHYYAKYLDDDADDETISQPEPTLSEIESKVEIGLANVTRVLSDFRPLLSDRAQSQMNQLLEAVNRLSLRAENIEEIRDKIDSFVTSSEFLNQANTLGVVSIHRNRLDAIEHEFFRKMQDEDAGIDIVGSTIFGLKGRGFATNAKIVDLLRSKKTRDNFRLRILLTHWDSVSGRQAQEKTEKNVARYVIARELLDAVRMLVSSGLADCVRFYRGAPTCFTIICGGQQQMLLNPYPYECEAFNSWCIVFRDTYGGIHEDFKKAHFEQPWSNPSLTVPYSERCIPALEKRYKQEVKRAKEDLEQEISALDEFE